MAKKKTAPYIPHRFKRTMKVKNKKRKDLYVTKTLFYYWWLDENGKKHYGSTGFETASEADKAIADLIEKKSLGRPADEITLGEYAEPFFVEGKCPILTDLKDMKKDYSPDFARWTHNQIEKHNNPLR